MQSFLRIYQKFFPKGDCTQFANLVFRVFDENHVRKAFEDLLLAGR